MAPFLRTPVGNIAAEVAYANEKAKVEPSLALENIRDKTSGRIRRPFAVLLRADWANAKEIEAIN